MDEEKVRREMEEERMRGDSKMASDKRRGW